MPYSRVRKEAVATRRVGCGGRGSTAAGWRRHVVAAAVLTSAAVLLLLPHGSLHRASLWLSAPTSDADDPSVGEPLIPKTSVEQTFNSSSTAPPPPPPFMPPSVSPPENFDDSVEEFVLPDLKVPPFVPKPNSVATTSPVPSPQELPNTFTPTPPLPRLPTFVSSGSSVEGVDTTRIELPFRLEAPIWPSPADQELIYARRELDNVPAILNDADLYAPLFRNVSVFKRSYELMESILKVYVYQDGEKPIFHTPELKGIYASEGWFMKLMERSKKFVIKDPSKAHLFYLPYSSRQFEYNLYVPTSHTIMPLAMFLKQYINMLAVKYPFWNRTKGSDHFLVACHDWGPYTTQLHNELRKNTIKALCNADISEGVFIRGKDVSLPETYIKIPKRPLRDIGGEPASQRTILAFFAGQMHGRVRPVLLQYWGSKDEDMRIYGLLPSKISRKMSYAQHMKSSKFCICPMGYEVNSPRIVEAIYYECVPVIIADNFVLPFDDVLDWGAFSVVVAEKDVPRLKEILLSIPQSRYISMQMNVKRVQKHFMWHAEPVKYDLYHMILHSIWLSRLNNFQPQK